MEISSPDRKTRLRRPAPPLRTVAFAVTGAVSACGEAAHPSAAATSLDSSGVEIVESTRPLWTERDRWRVAGTPELEIGMQNGEPEYLFSGITGVVRLSDGRIAVLNSESSELRFYDPSGIHLGSTGRRGGGPGEFLRPEHLQRLTGDTLKIWDTGLGPVTILDPAGGYIDQYGFSPAEIMTAIGFQHSTEALTPLPDGSFILHVSRRDTSLAGRPTGKVYRPPLGFFRVHPDFTEIDSLGWYGGLSQLHLNVGGRRIGTTTLVRLYSYVVGGGSPLRIFTGDANRYVVQEFDSDGNLVRSIRREMTPIQVPDALIEYARESRLAAAERGNRRAEMQRVLDALPDQIHFPPFRGLFVDSAGYLWVHSEGEGWSVFDRQGRWLGVVESFPDIRPFVIGRDYILGVHVDEVGVERVRMYRLERDRQQR